MSPEAETFVKQVANIDPEIAELIRGELERGVNLYALKEMLRTAIAAKRAEEAARASINTSQSQGEATK
jgi:hypothetical protein